MRKSAPSILALRCFVKAKVLAFIHSRVRCLSLATEFSRCFPFHLDASGRGRCSKITMSELDTGSEKPANTSCWTDLLPCTEHVDLFRHADYGPTQLGPIVDWPLSLRNYVLMVFTDSRAACIYWGENRIAMYDSPACMGWNQY